MPPTLASQPKERTTRGTPEPAPVPSAEAGTGAPAGSPLFLRSGFSFSLEDMESRLEETPGGPPPRKDAAPETDPAALPAPDQEAPSDVPPPEDAGLDQQGPEAQGKGPAGKMKGGPGPAAPLPGIPPTPGPASIFEGITDAAVGDYLNGHLDPSRVLELDGTTGTLLEAARGLGQKPVVEPEDSLLGSLTGVSALGKALFKPAPGYEKEEPWLATVARIREIASSLGGVVGTIGLLCTVSGAILSLLLPPVGAFLLTVGRFCDVASLVLDAVSLVLGIFLTGYNLYRLKQATDPEERARLLGLVRQDAMATVMSGIGVATAIAPGVGKKLAGTKRGKKLLDTAGRKTFKLRQGASNAFKAVKKSKVGKFAGKPFRALGSVKSRVTGRIHSGAEKLRGFAGVQKLNAGLEARLLKTNATGMLGKDLRQNLELAKVIQEGSHRAHHIAVGRRMKSKLNSLQKKGVTNITDLGEALEKKFGYKHHVKGEFGVSKSQKAGLTSVDPSIKKTQQKEMRSYANKRLKEGADLATIEQEVGAKFNTTGKFKLQLADNIQLKGGKKIAPKDLADMKKELDDLVRAGHTDPDVLRKKLEDKFGRKGRREGDFFLVEKKGRVKFGRADADVLKNVRQQEMSAIEGLRAKHPQATSEQLADLVNSDPMVRGRWTPEELDAVFKLKAEGKLGSKAPKTPHHTIPAQAAPHLHRKPEYMQVVNDPRVAKKKPKSPAAQAKAAEKKAGKAEAAQVKAETRAEAAKAKAQQRAEAAKEKVQQKAEAAKAKVQQRAEDAKAKVQQEADAAKAKTQGKAEDAKAKAQHKAEDAKAKAQQKAEDAKAKAQQKAEDAKAKAQQKAEDAKAKADEKAEKAMAEAKTEKAKAKAQERADAEKAEAQDKAEAAKAKAQERADAEKVEAQKKADADKAKAQEKAEVEKAEAEDKAEAAKAKAQEKAKDAQEKAQQKAEAAKAKTQGKADIDKTKAQGKADAAKAKAQGKADAAKAEADAAKAEADAAKARAAAAAMPPGTSPAPGATPAPTPGTAPAPEPNEFREFLDEAYDPAQLPRVPKAKETMILDPATQAMRPANNRGEVLQDWIRQGRFEGITDPGYFESEAFYKRLRELESTGKWTNPNNPSQGLLMDAHGDLGHHGGKFRDAEGTRPVFGSFAEREGETTRRIVEQAAAQGGRIGPRMIWPPEKEGEGLPKAVSAAEAEDLLPWWIVPIDVLVDAPADAAGPSLAPAPPGAWPGLDGDQSSEAPEASAWMDPAGFPPDWFGPMEGELPGSDSLAAFLPGFLGPQEQEVPQGAGGTGTPELPQPPDEVPYSPDSLVSIREMRLSVSEAMDTVRSYIDASDDSRKGNEAALAKVGELQESHTGQKDAIGLQKTEITGQQGKLDQAGEAQKNMSKEGEKASGESEKAKTEGDTVKSKGSTVTVEAKPEEPESKSWLERAWDATAGAAWDALVAPAVRAVKRKVEGVMESISGFLMGVINQALGLDEIEAELQQGGSDIQKRDESLGTTETGLGEVEGETALAMEQNAATSQQAKDNIGEAGAVRGEAEGLLGNLVAHDTALAADEAAGEVYVADFSLRYGEVFAPSKEAESTAGEEDAWA